MQDIVATFLIWLVEVIQVPPGSGIFVVMVSMMISTISNLAMKRFADIRRLNRYQAEVKQHKEMEKKAKESGNVKLLRKVKRRKPYIDRIQREMLTQRCKPQLLFIIPFMFVFAYLRGFYSITDPVSGAVTEKIVAILPFNVQNLLPFLNGFIGQPVAGGFGMWFWPFYFMVGLGLGQILQRVMGTNVMSMGA